MGLSSNRSSSESLEGRTTLVQPQEDPRVCIWSEGKMLSTPCGSRRARNMRSTGHGSPRYLQTLQFVQFLLGKKLYRHIPTELPKLTPQPCLVASSVFQVRDRDSEAVSGGGRLVGAIALQP